MGVHDTFQNLQSDQATFAIVGYGAFVSEFLATPFQWQRCKIALLLLYCCAVDAMRTPVDRSVCRMHSQTLSMNLGLSIQCPNHSGIARKCPELGLLITPTVRCTAMRYERRRKCSLPVYDKNKHQQMSS